MSVENASRLNMCAFTGEHIIKGVSSLTLIDMGNDMLMQSDNNSNTRSSSSSSFSLPPLKKMRKKMGEKLGKKVVTKLQKNIDEVLYSH